MIRKGISGKKRSSHGSKSSKRTRVSRSKRLQIDDPVQKSGFTFLDIEPDEDGNDKAQIIRKGIIGDIEDEETGYFIERYDVANDDTTVSELFEGEEARFTGEFMYFFAKNFNVLDHEGFFDSFGRSNPFKDVANNTRSYFSHVQDKNRDGELMFYNPETGREYAEDEIPHGMDVLPKMHDDTWFTYEININPVFMEELTDNKRSDEENKEEAFELLSDIVYTFMENFRRKDRYDDIRNFTNGYILRRYNSEGQLEEEEFYKIKNQVSQPNEEIIKVPAIQTQRNIMPLYDNEGNYITDLHNDDIFRMRINNEYITPDDFQDFKQSQKYIKLYKILSGNERPDIRMEFNADIVEYITNGRRKMKNGIVEDYTPVEDKVKRHPAFLAHSTSDDVSDLTRLSWLTLVRDELRETDRVPVLVNDTVNDSTAIGFRNKTEDVVTSTFRDDWETLTDGVDNLVSVEEQEESERAIKTRGRGKQKRSGKEVIL